VHSAAESSTANARCRQVTANDIMYRHAMPCHDMQPVVHAYFAITSHHHHHHLKRVLWIVVCGTGQLCKRIPTKSSISTCAQRRLSNVSFPITSLTFIRRLCLKQTTECPQRKRLWNGSPTEDTHVLPGRGVGKIAYQHVSDSVFVIIF